MTSVTPSGNLDQRLPTPALTLRRQSGRRRFLSALASSAGAIAGVGILRSAAAPVVATAQSSVDALVGSWAYDIAVTTPDFTPVPVPPLKGLITFHGDGTVVETFTQQDVQPPALRHVGSHGAWTALGGSAYTFTLMWYLVGDDAIFAGFSVLTREPIALGEDGNSWSGKFFTTRTDASGSVVGTNQGTIQGRRIQVQM
jgi:hypothetical protein